MTIKEKAEEFVDTLLKKDNPELDKFLDESLGNLNLTVKQAGVLLGIIKGVGISSYLEGVKVKINMTTISDYSVLEYAKTIIKDLLDNSDEYARQRAIDFLKKEEEDD